MDLGFEIASQSKSLSTPDAAQVYSPDMLERDLQDTSFSSMWAMAPTINSSDAATPANPYTDIWATAPTIDSSNAAPSANPYTNMWAAAPTIDSSNAVQPANSHPSMWATAPTIDSTKAATLANPYNCLRVDWNGPALVDPRFLTATAS